VAVGLQMGTARMGSDPKTSVTDTRGETHQVAGLWVADASLFPTASGVNPMVSVSSMAFCVAHHLAADLTGQTQSLTYPTDCAVKFDW
jgi:choline dehydrogenase-like flavoprotein